MPLSINQYVGPRITIPTCMKWIGLFIQCKDDWKYRYAALMCLFAIIEVCITLTAGSYVMVVHPINWHCRAVNVNSP